ncbi:MAG: hypothetical protein L6R35_002628 [Caloplaca aegaea]|nr:MAG: hypothetical protein L6R35_002628 [Caloplaca aegaea]
MLLRLPPEHELGIYPELNGNGNLLDFVPEWIEYRLSSSLSSQYFQSLSEVELGFGEGTMSKQDSVWYTEVPLRGIKFRTVEKVRNESENFTWPYGMPTVSGLRFLILQCSNVTSQRMERLISTTPNLRQSEYHSLYNGEKENPLGDGRSVRKCKVLIKALETPANLPEHLALSVGLYYELSESLAR